MFTNVLKTSLKGAGLMVLLSASSTLLAQESEVVVSSSASGQAGALVSVPVELTANNHNVASMQFDVSYDDTNLTLNTGGDGAPGCPWVDLGPAVTTNGNSVNCSEPAPATLRVLITAPFVVPTPALPTGELVSIRFDVAGSAAAGTYPLTVSNGGMADTAGDDLADPDFSFVDGSLEVLDVPPEDVSELAVSPASLAFGTVDLGNMPVSDTITAENVGGSNSSLTISGATYSGDAEFSVTNDGCAGQTLNFGDTCTVTVEFNAGANGSFNGSVAFASDADTNPNPNVEVSGTADSVPNLSVNPAFGPVDLGDGFPGDTVTANGSISNSGSAPGDFDCTLSDPSGVFSTTPSPLSGTVPAGGSVDFSLSCALPADSEDGDTFSGTLTCSGDISGTHDLSCGVSEFEPLPVPTMQQWGLIVLTLMMLLVGGISIRFFRA